MRHVWRYTVDGRLVSTSEARAIVRARGGGLCRLHRRPVGGDPRGLGHRPALGARPRRHLIRGYQAVTLGRLAAGRHDVDVARLLQIRVPTISDYELGKSEPPFFRVVALAKLSRSPNATSSGEKSSSLMRAIVRCTSRSNATVQRSAHAEIARDTSNVSKNICCMFQTCSVRSPCLERRTAVDTARAGCGHVRGYPRLSARKTLMREFSRACGWEI